MGKINVKTIKQMADDVIENRLFDDEFEELEYRWGYEKGAHDIIDKVKELINSYCDINASQALLLDNINEYLDALIGESNG